MPNVLTHSPADIVRRLLISLGQGTTPSANSAWPVFATGAPNSPDNVITVYDTAGESQGRSMINGELYTLYGTMVWLRAADAVTGFMKADAVRKAMALTYQKNVTIDGKTYQIHCLSRIGTVIPLGNETPTSKRSLFTINALATIDAVN